MQCASTKDNSSGSGGGGGFFAGVGLGWYYPAENLLFLCILPKGQEAEIAGFWMYCTIILAWFTPLIFGILVQKGVDPKWGMTFIRCFILIPAAMLRFCAGTWEEILDKSGRTGAAVTTSPVIRSVASIPVLPEPDKSGVISHGFGMPRMQKTYVRA